MKQAHVAAGVATVLGSWAAIAALLFVASAHLAHPRAVASMPHHCADLVAEAFASGAPVNGVWDCLDSKAQALAVKEGAAPGDAFIAVPSAFSNPRLVYECKVPLGYVSAYLLDIAPQPNQPQTTHDVLVVWLDNQGKVMNFGAGVPILL